VYHQTNAHFIQSFPFSFPRCIFPSFSFSFYLSFSILNVVTFLSIFSFLGDHVGFDFFSRRSLSRWTISFLSLSVTYLMTFSPSTPSPFMSLTVFSPSCQLHHNHYVSFFLSLSQFSATHEFIFQVLSTFFAKNPIESQGMYGREEAFSFK